MLSALKNLKNKAQKKAKELVSTVTHGGKVGKARDISRESSTLPEVFGYIENGVLHDYREALDFDKEIKKQLFFLGETFDRVDNGKDFPRMYKNSYEVYSEEEWKIAENRFRSSVVLTDVESLIAGNIPQKIIGELYNLKSDKIKFAALEENLDENKNSFPVARLASDRYKTCQTRKKLLFSTFLNIILRRSASAVIAE